LAVAQAGINFMHENFEYIEPGTNTTQKFSEYMAAAASKGSFQTGMIVGTGAKGGKPLVVPYKGNDLTGPSLKKYVLSPPLCTPSLCFQATSKVGSVWYHGT
jgi:hypothetical protein